MAGILLAAASSAVASAFCSSRQVDEDEGPVPVAAAPAAQPKKLAHEPRVPQELLSGRLAAELEPETSALPPGGWCQGSRSSCKEELVMSPGVRVAVPEISRIINDVSMRVFELSYVPMPTWLDADCRFAIAAYTHDLRSGQRTGNLYFELNKQLRQRSFFARRDARETWGGFMFHLMRGLSRLPDWEGECFHGCPDADTVLTCGSFAPGKCVQFGCFWSASTSLDVVKETIQRETGLIFRLRVRSGRDVKPYSFLPADGEILLTPEHRFTVAREAYHMLGFFFVDLHEEEGHVAFEPPES